MIEQRAVGAVGGRGPDTELYPNGWNHQEAGFMLISLPGIWNHRLPISSLGGSLLVAGTMSPSTLQVGAWHGTGSG